MKKTRFLAMILVVSIMLMGAGYAAWNESITISSTVDTGNLSVAMSTGNVYVYPNASMLAEDGFTNTQRTLKEAILDSSAVEKNVVNVKVNNLYPGARVKVVVPIANDGSIPVKLEGNVFANNNTSDWLTITNPTGPTEIAVGASQNITFYVDVKDNAPEGGTADFSITANYIQFNQ